MDIKDLIKDDFKGKEWIGEVVDNNDPEFQLRCKVKIFGIFDNIPTDKLPWCFPANNFIFAGGESNGYGGSFSVPKIGTLVKVRFVNGDIYTPEYYSIQNINENLQNELSNDYDGSHVILYDDGEKIKILFQKNTGLKIFFKDSHITINPDSSITIEHKDSESIIELNGPNCKVVTNSTIELTTNDKVEITANECVLNGTSKTQLGPIGNYSAVGAEPLWQFLKSLAAALDAKWPPSPGVNSSAAEVAEKLSTSQNNKVSVP